MATRAVFLDLDGVLIDSMQAHAKAWVQMLAEHGIKMDELQIYLREGEKAEDTIALLMEQHGLQRTPEEQWTMIERKREIYRQAAPQRLRADARQLVDELRQRHIQLTIVTGSNRRNVDKTVPPDEQELFEQIITADDYRRGKPAPDPYLSALAQSGFRPDECRILENAPLGIQAGTAAGIFTVAITTTLPAQYLTAADAIIDSYQDFLKYL